MFLDRLLKFDLSLVTGDEIWIMALGYMIVFIVLALLFIVFQNLPILLGLPKKIRSYIQKRRESLNPAPVDAKMKKEKLEISGELNAAISAAIHLYASEQHDEESAILTIEKVSRRYSPWSSKIYSVTNLRR